MKKKNDIVGDQEFEKLLKDKMNELSSSVDCFDKISSRAFPENDSDFSDSEFTVRDLENVTGRRKAVPVLKWTAVAAAAVLFVGILPQTAFVQEFISNIANDNDSRYRSILAEISEENIEHTYKIYDMPLKEYIEKDVLITPYYSCPFYEDEKDDINVRIYIRMYNELPTNQIYAVEYAGDYDKNNILAVAESKAKFTDSDFEKLGLYEVLDDNLTQYAVNKEFFGSKRDDVLDGDGQKVMAASFMYDHLFKYNDNVDLLYTEVLYCNYMKDNRQYFYDMAATAIDEETGQRYLFEMPDEKDMWNCSVYFNGTSVMPKEDHSLFTRKKYFTSKPNDESNGSSLNYYKPYANVGEDILDGGSDHLEIKNYPNGDYAMDNSELQQFNQFTDNNDSDSSKFNLFGFSLEFTSEGDDEYIGERVLDTPACAYSKKSMKIYTAGVSFLMYSSYSDPYIGIKIAGSDNILKIHRNDICYDIDNSEDTINAENAQMQSAIEDNYKSQVEAKKNYEEMQKDQLIGD